MVDLARALNPRSPLTLSIRLSTRQEQSTLPPHSLAIPSLEPLDAVLRQGVLAVSVDPLFQVALQQLSVPLGPPEKAGPWAASVPQYFFPYRDKAVTGRVRLFPQKARVRVRCQEEVVLTKGRGSLSARLELEPVLGNPTSLDFMVASPREAFLDWQVETGFVRSLGCQGLPEALPSLLFLGARSHLERALLQNQLPVVQHWRLQFARPLTGRETVALRATLEPLRAVNPSAPAVCRPAADFACTGAGADSGCAFPGCERRPVIFRRALGHPPACGEQCRSSGCGTHVATERGRGRRVDSPGTGRVDHFRRPQAAPRRGTCFVSFASARPSRGRCRAWP